MKLRRILTIILSLVMCFGLATGIGCGEERAIFTITFDADGGTVAEQTKQVELSKKVGKLPVAEKEGWVFQTWVFDNNGTEVEIDADTIYSYKKDITLKATYTQEPCFTITLNLTADVGGTPVTATLTEGSNVIENVPYGSKLADYLPDAEDIQIGANGCEFEGWCYENGNQIDLETTILNKATFGNQRSILININITGAIIPILPQYTVTLNLTADVGGTPVTAALSEGSTVIEDVSYGRRLVDVLPTLDKIVLGDAYLFAGWTYENGAKIDLETAVFDTAAFGEQRSVTINIALTDEYTMDVIMNVGNVKYAGGDYTIKAKIGQKLSACGLLGYDVIDNGISPDKYGLEGYKLGEEDVSAETVVTKALFGNASKITITAVYEEVYSDWV
ncbi:MAG: hypothetical protein E7369_01010 [Clostridiales bacterium]|nr:hypothetical protein [Clostridiales bacterium]